MNRIIVVMALLLGVCGLQYVYPQTHGEVVPMSFEVKDSTTSEVLVGVTCRVYSSSGALYSYGISDRNGQIKLQTNKNGWLEFSFLGYEKQRMRIGSIQNSRRKTIYLKPSAVALREVQIKAPPISARKDTLVYHVGAFTKAGDRHLEDVLKRLPGVKVSENGTISVQGKAINKFYIEGMDLVGSNYNQVTKNMPIEAVTSVEVLENHQPVKMLQGKQLSDKAALNIKIDKSHKSRPFGELEGGLGLWPSRWDNRVFITQIANKSQFLLSGKMNNTGNDLSEETTEHIDVSDLEAYEPVPSPLMSTDLMQETLPQNRYLYNKSYAGGVNYLQKLTDNSTLRFNTQFYEDHSSRSNSIEYNYGGSLPFRLMEETNMKKKNFTVVPILKYELNSANSYVSDEIRVSISRKSAFTSVWSNGISIKETIKSRPSYFQNYFSSSFSVGNRLIQAKSLIRYFDRSESIVDLSDSINLYNVSDRYAFKSFVTKNTVSSKFLLFGNYLDLGLKTYYKNNCYNFESNTHHHSFCITFTPNYYVKYGRRSSLSLGGAMAWHYARLCPVLGSEKSRAFFSFTPEISINHVLTNAFTLGFSASLGASNETEPFYSRIPIRTGYRTIYTPDNNLYKSTDYLLLLRLKYRDLASMFFSNLSVSYSQGRHESYLHYDYTDSLNIVRQTEGDNNRKMFMVNGMADKSFVDAGLSIKAEVTYSQNSYLLSQSTELINNTSHIMSAHASSTFQNFNWLRLVIDAAGTLYWDKNSFHDAETLVSVNTNASVYVFPFKGFEIKMKCQYITNEISPSQYKSLTLLDASLHYKINKMWEIGLTGANLLNTEHYAVTQNSGLNSYCSSLPLRGREILFRLLLHI